MRLFGGVRLVDRPYPENVRRLDEQCIPIINEMNRRGVMIDPSYFATLNEQILYERDRNLLELECLIGRSINPGSADQVAVLLFEELKVQGTGRVPLTPSRQQFSTGDEILSIYKDVHPAVSLVLNWRELEKLRNTYTERLPLMRGPDGRVRTRLKMTATTTGRLASEEPNLQNIPIKGDWGKKIRYGFVASGNNVLCSQDLSQIEMVWLAHLSGDENLRQVFIQKKDIHTSTASRIFRIPEEQVQKGYHRLVSKTLNYLIVYGATAQGLQLQIASAGGPWWELADCERFISDWFTLAYSGVKLWMEEQYRRARQYGMVWDSFGRHRWMPGARSAIPRVRSKAEREAGNQPVQASAGGHLKLAQAEVYQVVQYYQSRGKVCWPLLPIHDELLFEVEPDIAEEFSALVQLIMRNAVPLSIPVGADGAVGHSWGELK